MPPISYAARWRPAPPPRSQQRGSSSSAAGAPQLVGVTAGVVERGLEQLGHGPQAAVGVRQLGGDAEARRPEHALLEHLGRRIGRRARPRPRGGPGSA